MEKLFQDRTDAGKQLAVALKQYAGTPDLLVLGLPRGGVAVAYEIADFLRAPLDVFVVRKLGAPGQEELAMGAIASGGARVLNEAVVNSLGISQAEIEKAAAVEEAELKRREKTYRGTRPPLQVKGRPVILADDGLATGATMRAAELALKKLNPSSLLIAVPVAAEDTCREFRERGSDLVCLYTPFPFYSVGMWYEDFGQTSDEEVKDFLARASKHNLRGKKIP